MVHEEIRLVKPTLKLEKEVLKYRQEHFDFGEQIINRSESFNKISSYSEWLEKVIANASFRFVYDKRCCNAYKKEMTRTVSLM